MKILSIDAWGNSDDDWEWNAWYKVGVINKEDFEHLHSDEDFITWFIDAGYVSNFTDKMCIIDDQYNIVLCSKETLEPLFAIEYGSEY